MTRIVPLYWLFTGLMVALKLAVPGQFTTHFSPDLALRSLGFVAFTTGREPLIYPGWTLEYEMAFYLLATLSIGFGMATWTLLPCVLAGLAMMGALIHPSSVGLAFLGRSVLLEFAMGVVLCQWVIHRQIRPVAVAMVVLALGSIAFAQPGDRVLVAGLPAVLLLALATLGESRLEGEGWLRWLVARLGDASYAIYLVQVFPLSAIYKVTKHLVPAMPFAPMVLIETVATIAIGLGVHLWVEKPMLQQIRRLGAAKTVAAQPGS